MSDISAAKINTIDSTISSNNSRSPNCTTTSSECTAKKPDSPPPLMAIDEPNPPNVTISKSATIPSLISTTVNSSSVTSDSNQFLLNTRQIVTASRLDPELLLTSCATNKEIDDVDLDRMYMEAMLEDMKCNMSR